MALPFRIVTHTGHRGVPVYPRAHQPTRFGLASNQTMAEAILITRVFLIGQPFQCCQVNH